MRWEQLSKLGCELPEVVEDVWFRTPALKVRGKSFVRLKEDGESVVFLVESVDEQLLDGRAVFSQRGHDDLLPYAYVPRLRHSSRST